MVKATIISPLTIINSHAAAGSTLVGSWITLHSQQQVLQQQPCNTFSIIVSLMMVWSVVWGRTL